MAKYALVTGGSRGIGRAVCVKLAEMGYNVLINYAGNTAAAEETLQLVREAGTDGELMKFDVSDSKAVRTAIETWQAAHEDNDEYVEILVNNAGIRKDNIMGLMPAEDWSSVLNVTLGGFYNVTQPLLMPMQFHKFGRIINMASVSGIMGMQGQTNYSAAKGGLIAATKALAKEVAKKNVTCNAIAPGFIKTDMVDVDLLQRERGGLRVLPFLFHRLAVRQGLSSGFESPLRPLNRDALALVFRSVQLVRKRPVPGHDLGDPAAALPVVPCCAGAVPARFRLRVPDRDKTTPALIAENRCGRVVVLTFRTKHYCLRY